MSKSKKAERREARKNMVRQAEAAQVKKVVTITFIDQVKSFFSSLAWITFITGIIISILCGFAVEDFQTSRALWCTVYITVIIVMMGIVIPSKDDESEAIKRARLLKEAKKSKFSDSLGCMTIGAIFISVGIVNFFMITSWSFGLGNLKTAEYVLGMIAWTFLGGHILVFSISNDIKYRKILAEEAAGATFVELPPDKDEEEFARLVAEAGNDAPFNTDSHPNNIDAENDYIDDPDYDYTPNRRNACRVPTFALDSRPNNVDAENSYIDDPDYERGENRYNCHRSPATRRNSRQSNALSSDDSFYDEVQY